MSMQGLKLFIYLLAGGHSFTFHQAHPHPNSRALSSSSSSLSSTGSFEDALSSLNKQFSSTKAQSTQDFTVPNNIGIGTLAWGDSTRGYGSSYNPGDLNAAYNTLLSNGITFIDTAEVYGYKGINKGESSEQLIGKFMEANFDGARPIIGTKYMPILWTNILVGGGFRFGSKSVFNALQKSCDRLEIAYCDLYQLHFPFPYVGGRGSLVKGLKMAIDRGLCNHVGVSNYSGKQLLAMSKKFESADLKIATNQVEFSLVNRKAMFDGTLEACKKLNIVPLAHTPLAGGLASGKYTAMNPTGGKMGKPKYEFTTLDKLLPLHNALGQVASMVKSRLKDEYDVDRAAKVKEVGLEKLGKDRGLKTEITTTQVSLNWIVGKGAVPLPGVKNNNDAMEIVGCLGWRLNGEEMEVLDKACDIVEGT